MEIKLNCVDDVDDIKEGKYWCIKDNQKKHGSANSLIILKVR